MAEPRRRRGESTRQAILAAAEAVFAEHGYDGARIDVIADVSGFDKKLIFRYFGDKLGLYAEVLRRTDRELRELQTRMLAPLNEAFTGTSLATAIGAIFDYLVAHPRFLRILTWEMAEGWQTTARIISERDREDVEQLGPLLSQAQRGGRLRSDFIPAIQMTMVLQVCQSFLAYLPLYRKLLPEEDVSSADAMARAREYIVTLLVRGMMAGPDGGETGEIQSSTFALFRESAVFLRGKRG
jgi:TetR/AcrR family transcriptional regulator